MKSYAEAYARCAVAAAALGLLTTIGLATPATLVAQQDQEPEVVQQAKLARTGAGLRVSYWNLQDLPEVQNGVESRWPLLEGYFQRGLDRHLAIESTLGVWRRDAESEGGGGVLGSGSGSAVTTWIVPILTTLKFHPFTGPEAGTEPYIAAGAGVVLAVQDSEGGSLGGGGMTTATGFGLKGEAGTALRLSEAFGLTLFAGYQWLRLGQNAGGTDTYKGFNFGAGLSYRFQY